MIFSQVESNLLSISVFVEIKVFASFGVVVILSSVCPNNNQNNQLMKKYKKNRMYVCDDYGGVQKKVFYVEFCVYRFVLVIVLLFVSV
jgi:hypothetical protein